MKFLLVNYMNPKIWNGLSEHEQQEVIDGHGDFQKTITESGEFIGALAVADPSQSAVVRVRAGDTTTTEGPHTQSEEFFAGYYLIEAESRDRALEIAAQVPDASINVIEVRPVIYLAS
ncbi:YciI family protein [Nocardia sp. NPDC057030]|uniref:YciI family protein n=1 Tax=unclassified Nocardia TaxID=2637762 RepID=UPI003637453E